MPDPSVRPVRTWQLVHVLFKSEAEAGKVGAACMLLLQICERDRLDFGTQVDVAELEFVLLLWFRRDLGCNELVESVDTSAQDFGDK